MKWSGKMTKIKDLKVSDRLTGNLLIKSCVNGVSPKGSPYLNLVLQDDTGMLDGKFWNVKQSDIEAVVVGEVASVTYEVLDYNHQMQLRVNKVERIDQNEIDMRDYVMSSVFSKEELMKRMEDLISSIQNDTYQMLVRGVLEMVGEDFYNYPAASRIHHNYMGGLAEHTLGMAKLAYDVCDNYPMLDRDLLVAGIIMHDVGKVKELGGLISSEYTLAGKLVGHISIGQGWLMEVSKDLGIEDKEEAILLRHMVLAHHGKMEFGSPILPKIPEAEVLSLIDNIDARMNTIEQAFENVEPGQWSQRIFALENRQFYKSNYAHKGQE